jgi:hypothetical protein
MVAVGALAAALVVAIASSEAAVSTNIRAYFDADGHLMFTFSDGTQVSGTIPSGTYQVQYDNLGADDLAVDHAFHLFGPGIDFAPAPSVIQSTFSVTFVNNGTYTLRDDLHPTVGGRTFVASSTAGSDTPVGGATASTGPTASTKSTTKAVANDIVGTDVAVFRGNLAAGISSSGKLTLTFKGKTVSSLKSGRYKLVIDDRSKAKGFQLQRIKKPPLKLTGVKSTGKKTVTLTLDAGQWWFFSGGPSKGYFVVTK